MMKLKLLSLIFSLFFLISCTSVNDKIVTTPTIDPIRSYNLYDPGYIPHIADTGLSIYSISLGGVELNPLGFPLAVVGKIVYETAAYQYKKAGRSDICYYMASGARVGSSMGFGGTLGSLIFGGMPPLIAGAIIAGAISFHFSTESAKKTCYDDYNIEKTKLQLIPVDNLNDNNTGFGNK